MTTASFSTCADVLVACYAAMQRAILIQRVSRSDKEFHFQNWVSARLDDAGLQHDFIGRNSYPDFTLVHHPEGYEVKGLQWPGREASYDSNSRVPTGKHNGRIIYYVFGRYPTSAEDPEYPVVDLVLCHGDFLNADHTYTHRNTSFRGFGSYGDLLVRDRKMYVAPTPFALTSGTTGQATLIVRDDTTLDGRLEQVGELVRTEIERMVEPITEFDRSLYAECSDLLGQRTADLVLPLGELDHGENTRQAIRWGFTSWRQFFNDRQLYSLGLLAATIRDLSIGAAEREALVTLFSGTREFNNVLFLQGRRNRCRPPPVQPSYTQT